VIKTEGLTVHPSFRYRSYGILLNAENAYTRRVDAERLVCVPSVENDNKNLTFPHSVVHHPYSPTTIPTMVAT
jgi:hypothetical protein